MSLPQPLPDNPTRWDGWRGYHSENPYERLCLSFDERPGNEQIEDNCRQLLIWWQKKLPLKNQPSNPLSQMLRGGLDEAPKFLAEARTVLLDPVSRAKVDERMRELLKESAATEFYKFLAFALASNSLAEEDEKNLYHLGAAASLTQEDMKSMVDAELAKRGATRRVKEVPAVVIPTNANATAPPRLDPGAASSDPKMEFARMLRLTGLSEDDLTDDQRDALCNMGENLGLTGGQAEDLIDEYLEEMSGLPPVPVVSSSRTIAPARPTPTSKTESVKVAERITGKVQAVFTPLAREQERQKFPPFRNSLGMEMMLVTSGTFTMGSAEPGASPNEQPLSLTNLTGFHMARHPVTNRQYEFFDPKHRFRRPAWANESHPVVYVSSLDAIRFCEWLSARERKKYRLPTEAEWEYAARGTDSRVFPWGSKLTCGDLANFADSNTSFAWRDPNINDGYAHSAPIGAYPRGASPFGVEDLAGNVWEWCLDFFEPYKSNERTNPQSKAKSGPRIHRGGSWKSRAANLRTTARGFNAPDFLADDLGFRIVCEHEA
ncbi:MAG: hypothetical protein QOD99_161 [Chthoniobacter sp.]|jgi:formylglycine-generating enzyme required for sulfatase activity|nr:hypothetical protein [Chthoniobacter sp.]